MRQICILSFVWDYIIIKMLIVNVVVFLQAISRLSGSLLDQRCIQIKTMRLDNIREERNEIKTLKADMIEYINELKIPGRGKRKNR